MKDSSDLGSKLIEVNQRRARLETENELLRKSNANSMAELTARCQELSAQVNGPYHNPELFGKEISRLSIDELKAKIAALETQLANQYRPGRKSSESSSVHQQASRETGGINPDLFRIKK